jgi:anaerobic magnesium-protoporphyrin IX monomethyl ester cyclase
MKRIVEKSEETSRIDVLLTYPHDGLRFFQSMMPIGLVSIGTVLKNAGYRVALIDFNHYSNDFQRQVARLSPKVIGIGGTTVSRRGSFLTARLSKKAIPDATVVYGGINATFTATEVLSKIPEIDFILKGEAELSFLRLCDALIRRGPVDPLSIPGLCWRSGEQIMENPPSRIEDLSVLPIPDRNLLGDNYSLEMEFLEGNGDFIMTSRGCPAACNFCSASRMFPGGIRLRQVDSVMAEIEYLRSRKNIAGIKLFDSTFTANRDHVERFCRGVREFGIPWECEIRADTVDESLLRLMKECGCYYINVGMETSHQHHLKHIAKGITPNQVLTALALCRKIGIHSKVFFTFGHMGQTFDECLRDIEFIETNKRSIDFFAVTVGMRIYPGTRLERECRQKGILGDRFSWLKNAQTIKNWWAFEPGDIPVLFQKQLGPFKLFAILALLFWKKLIGTPAFLKRMSIENALGAVRHLNMQFTYSRHKVERFLGLELCHDAWKGTTMVNGRTIPVVSRKISSGK